MSGALELCGSCNTWGTAWVPPSDNVPRCPTCGTPRQAPTAAAWTLGESVQRVSTVLREAKSTDEAVAAFHAMNGQPIGCAPAGGQWASYPDGGFIRVDLAMDGVTPTLHAHVVRMPPQPLRVTVTEGGPDAVAVAGVDVEGMN